MWINQRGFSEGLPERLGLDNLACRYSLREWGLHSLELRSLSIYKEVINSKELGSSDVWVAGQSNMYFLPAFSIATIYGRTTSGPKFGVSFRRGNGSVRDKM